VHSFELEDKTSRPSCCRVSPHFIASPTKYPMRFLSFISFAKPLRPHPNLATSRNSIPAQTSRARQRTRRVPKLSPYSANAEIHSGARAPDSAQEHSETLPPPPTEVVVTHATADFDTIASAVALARLRGPKTIVVLPTGADPTAQRFLSLHLGLYPIRPVSVVEPERLKWMAVVDCCRLERLGRLAEWTTIVNKVVVYDHHAKAECNIVNEKEGVELICQNVGATTTIFVEMMMMQQNFELTSQEATLFALGIHTDTGSLTYENTTPRDAKALSWLLEQGVNQRTIAEYTAVRLSNEQMECLKSVTQNMRRHSVSGLVVATCLIQTPKFVRGLSMVVSEVLHLSSVDVFILAASSPIGRNKSKNWSESEDEESAAVEEQVSVIARASAKARVDLAHAMEKYNGGGHEKAASASLRHPNPKRLLIDIMNSLRVELPPEPKAVEIMSEIRLTLGLNDTVEHAAQLIRDNALGGLPVVEKGGSGNENGGETLGKLVGMIFQGDVLTASKGGALNRPVSAFLHRKFGKVLTTDSISLVEKHMLEGKSPIPVVNESDELIGFVRRIDILKARRYIDTA